MDHSCIDNPMNATNMARSNYLSNHYIQSNVNGPSTTRKQRMPKKNKSCNQSRSRNQYDHDSLEESLAGMSISIVGDEDIDDSDHDATRSRHSSQRRRRRTSSSRHGGAETESQRRTRTKGKQRKKEVVYPSLMDDLNSEIARLKEERNKDGAAIVSVAQNHSGSDQPYDTRFTTLNRVIQEDNNSFDAQSFSSARSSAESRGSRTGRTRRSKRTADQNR